MRISERVQRLVRRIGIAAVVILATLALQSAVAPSARAAAQTCITAKEGGMCTFVGGENGYISWITSKRFKYGDLPGFNGICNYSAWFFYYQPGGPVTSLGTEEREGCGPIAVYLRKIVDNSLPIGTQVCTKFYEDHWQEFVAQKCVGLS